MPPECFDIAVYQRMLAGQLLADEAEKVLNHLEQCESCLQAVRKLPEDAIVATMRTKKKWAVDPVEPAFVHDLVEAILKHSGQDSAAAQAEAARLLFACPHCRGTIQVGKESAGMTVKCPLCGQLMRIRM